MLLLLLLRMRGQRGLWSEEDCLRVRGEVHRLRLRLDYHHVRGPMRVVAVVRLGAERLVVLRL